MTAITPLQSIHKKGLFGDHHKKNESDLLNITEVNNLNIIQIFQYKNSKVNIQDIQLDDLNLPLKSLQVSHNKDTRILWSGPNTWLVISKKENIFKIIEENCENQDFAITDISHSRSVIQIKGFEAKEVLKKGCPLNINDFNINSCSSSVFHGITITLDCINNEPQTFNLISLRSFGESLYYHITDASLEFGYVGV
jgi:heterotetrameric sarcosine oxidase gamma subunit